jgi:hypothetical protein
MDSTKFNLYDLFGVFIPGAVMCIILYCFLVRMNLIAQINLDWTQALLVLPLAYTVGTVIHHFTRKYIHTEKYSVNLLARTDTEFTEEFVDLLIKKMEATFKLVKPAEQNLVPDFYQMSFMLCYDYVIQNGKGVYTENFNALYGMCRSMIVVTVAAMVFAFLYLGFRDPYPDWMDRLFFITTTLFAGMFMVKIFHEGMLLNARRYAISVLRSFYLSPTEAVHAALPLTLDAPVNISLTVTQPPKK